MKKITCFVAVFLVMCTIIAIALNAANNTPFTDVPDSSWYTESVNYCFTEELMKGNSKTTFAPGMTVDRSQLVQVLANMSKYNENDYKGKTSFPDVKATDWFAPAVEWAKQNNVTSGTDKGTFNPKAPLNREQLAQFIYNYATLIGMDTDLDVKVIDSFKDGTTVAAWAKNAVAWNVSAGILTGSNNNLMPKKTATRAELAAIIERFDKLTKVPVLDLASNITVSGAFTDDMMLQRDEKCSVWGWAPESENGKNVAVKINGKTAVATVENGEWKAVFKETFPYSTEPTVITVQSANENIEFKNVLFGDVYYVIGQSNVYYSLKDQTETLASLGLSHELEFDFDESRNLRFFRNSDQYHRANTGDRAPGTATLYKDAEVWSGWQTISEVEDAYNKDYTIQALQGNPRSTYIFSALGYLTAYNMSKETDVPIGVIEIDASGFPLITFAPNELAEKWGTEMLFNAETGQYKWALFDVTIDGIFTPLFTTSVGLNGEPEVPLFSRKAYNQQLYPLINFSTAGIFWYQGESDWASTEEHLGIGADTFATQFTDLMTYYRNVMGNNDFPVYMIEFPSCFKGTSPYQAYISTGAVRTEQGKIHQLLDNFYLVSSSDFFYNEQYENNIHPYIKHLQAERLSKIVLATGNYGLNDKYDINYVCGPVLNSCSYSSENNVLVKFDNVGDGLKEFNDYNNGIKGFEILVNGEWIDATNVRITNTNTVFINYNDAEIKGVRYNHATDAKFYLDVTLGNSKGIPAVAFVNYKTLSEDK